MVHLYGTSLWGICKVYLFCLVLKYLLARDNARVKVSKVFEFLFPRTFSFQTFKKNVINGRVS